MNPLLSVALIWTILVAGMFLFGVACIKYGVYTTGDRAPHSGIEL